MAAFLALREGSTRGWFSASGAVASVVIGGGEGRLALSSLLAFVGSGAFEERGRLVLPHGRFRFFLDCVCCLDFPLVNAFFFSSDAIGEEDGLSCL